VRCYVVIRMLLFMCSLDQSAGVDLASAEEVSDDQLEDHRCLAQLVGTKKRPRNLMFNVLRNQP